MKNESVANRSPNPIRFTTAMIKTIRISGPGYSVNFFQPYPTAEPTSSGPAPLGGGTLGGGGTLDMATPRSRASAR